MSVPGRAPRILRTLLCAAVLVLGCRNVQRIDRADWGAIPPDEIIHVTTLDGTRTQLGEPVAYAGYLSGLPAGGGDRVRIPLDSIEFMEVREFSLGKSLIVGALAGTAIGIIAARGESDVRPPESSSCPFVYSFDGAGYRLDSETFAGAVARGLERTDVDNLQHLRAVDGRYRLLLTNERPEVQYTDALNLVVVDHPESARIVPDAEQRPRMIGRTVAPSTATDFGGLDVLADVHASDGRAWAGSPLGAEVVRAAPEALREGIELRFPRGADSALLLVEARNTELAPFALETFLSLQGDSLTHWYGAVARDPTLRSRLRGWFVREGMLHVSVWTPGGWMLQDALPDVGPHLPKTQVARLDLSTVTGDTVRIRLASARGLWTLDHVALAEAMDWTAETRTVGPRTAVDADGRDRVVLLSEEDERYHTAFPGDTVWVTYDAPPPPQPGFSRTVLVRSHGFYHLATDHTGQPTRRAVADRILDEPLFGNRYILERWLETNPGR